MNPLAIISRVRAALHDAQAQYFTREGNAAAKQKHYRRAADLWKDAGERGLASRSLGNSHLLSGDCSLFTDAAECYAEALAHPPRRPGVYFRPILLLQRTFALYGACYYWAAFDVACDIVAEDAAENMGAVGYRMLARVFGRAGQFAEAEDFVAVAAKHSRTPTEIAETFEVSCLIKAYQGRFTEVVTIFENRRADTKPSTQTIIYYADALSVIARFDEAASAYRSAIAQALVTQPATATLTVAFLQAELARLEAERRNHAEAHALLGVAAPALNDTPTLGLYLSAVRLFNDALSGHDTSDTLQTRIQAEHHRVQEAISSFPERTDGLRVHCVALTLIARACFASGNSAECLRTLELLAVGNVLLPGALPAWHFWHGRAYEALGDTNAARREYESAISSGEPENRYVKDARRWLAGLSGDAPDAVQ